MAEGVFMSYRRGKHNQRNRQILIKIAGIRDRKEAARFIGRQAIWTSPKGTPHIGKIVGVLGRRGMVKATFQKGLPGDAIGAELRIH